MSNTRDTNKERDAFEAWAYRSVGRVWRANTPGDTEGYQDASTNLCWRAWQARASLSAEAEPTDDVKQKIASNQWDHFGDLLPTLKAISRGDWYWGANSRCKYIEIRLDTRDGGCLLFDRERVRISPEQFAHQSYGGVKMDPWPASNGLAAPAQAPAPGWVSVDERLPEMVQACDWLMPATASKRERWILAGESMASASVPGVATHWRLSMSLPAHPTSAEGVEHG
jgi:hypothetical protein